MEKSGRERNTAGLPLHMLWLGSNLQPGCTPWQELDQPPSGTRNGAPTTGPHWPGLCVFWYIHADDKSDFFIDWNALGIWISNILGKVRSNFSKGSERWSKKHDRSANEHDIYSWETYLWAGKTGYLPDGDSVQSPVQDKKSVFIPKLQAENLTEGGFKAVELRDNHFCMNILGPKYESWRNWRCASQVPVTLS